MSGAQALKGAGSALAKVRTAVAAAPLRLQLSSNGVLLPPPPPSMAISPTQMASGDATSSLTASTDRSYTSAKTLGAFAVDLAFPQHGYSNAAWSDVMCCRLVGRASLRGACGCRGTSTVACDATARRLSVEGP